MRKGPKKWTKKNVMYIYSQIGPILCRIQKKNLKNLCKGVALPKKTPIAKQFSRVYMVQYQDNKMCRNKKINNIKYQVLLVPTDLFAVCTTCPKTCFPTHSLRTNSLASHARGSSSVAAEFWVGRRPRQRRQMRIQDRIRLRQIPRVVDTKGRTTTIKNDQMYGLEIQTKIRPITNKI